MKRMLLCFALLSALFSTNAQIIVYVEAPSTNEGSYDFTYSQAASGWGSPDLLIPANSVTGVMEFVTNGVDSLSCGALTNDLTGNIAVLYRGTCEFGSKALNAQNAGAIGVIIINNIDGAPVGMGGGADGASVTIPVVMITAADGALLKPEIEAGTSTVFIGNKTGLYGDDIGMSPDEYLRAKSFGVVSLLSQDDTEFEVEVAAWVRNYGTNDQTDVSLHCVITMGSVIYDEISAPATILSGDSLYVSLPTFSQTTYSNGLYQMAYTVEMGATDEADFDNGEDCNFYINDTLYSLGRIDDSDGQPIQNTNQFNSGDVMETCLHFQDANASRVGVLGMTFSAGTPQSTGATSTDGHFVEIYCYEWNDVFTDFNDYPDWNSADLTEIAHGEYIYTSNMQAENVYIQFEDNPVLTDNQRYLFCLNVDTDLYPGYDTKVNYNGNFDQYQQPLNVLRTDFGQWYALGFGGDMSPAYTIHLYNSLEAGMVELPSAELDVYPNPATTLVTIPLKENKGNAVLTVADMSGKVVSVQNATANGELMVMDVTSIANGTYSVRAIFENGDINNFNIVVAR